MRSATGHRRLVERILPSRLDSQKPLLDTCIAEIKPPVFFCPSAGGGICSEGLQCRSAMFTRSADGTVGGGGGNRVEGNSNPTKYAGMALLPRPMNNNSLLCNTRLLVRNRAGEIAATLTTSYILKKRKEKKGVVLSREVNAAVRERSANEGGQLSYGRQHPNVHFSCYVATLLKASLACDTHNSFNAFDMDVSCGSFYFFCFL